MNLNLLCCLSVSFEFDKWYMIGMIMVMMIILLQKTVKYYKRVR